MHFMERVSFCRFMCFMSFYVRFICVSLNACHVMRFMERVSLNVPWNALHDTRYKTRVLWYALHDTRLMTRVP